MYNIIEQKIIKEREDRNDYSGYKRIIKRIIRRRRRI